MRVRVAADAFYPSLRRVWQARLASSTPVWELYVLVPFPKGLQQVMRSGSRKRCDSEAGAIWRGLAYFVPPAFASLRATLTPLKEAFG